MIFVGSTVRTLAVWAMIPLVLLSGTPVMGCVCANGQYKFLCQRQTAATEDPATTAPCSCCPQHKDGARETASSSCCKKAPRAASTGATVAARCCQEVLELPSPSVVVERDLAPQLEI